MIMLLQKQKDNKLTKNITKYDMIKSTVPVGLYDGLLGPGTGTYMAISMNKYLRINFLNSTATAKVLNLGTNVGATVAFLLAGKLFLLLALPMAFANIIGSYIGSHFAIKGGEKFIKKFIVIMLIIMLCANIIKLIFI